MATLFPSPPKPPQNLSPKFCCSTRRAFAVGNAAASMVSLTLALALPEISSPSPALSIAEPEAAPPRRPLLTGISSTKSWLQFYGDGFSIRVPPRFEDIMEPEDFSAGLALYGDKVKPKTFAARFASPDGSEVVSVVIKPSNQLKITFLEHIVPDFPYMNACSTEKAKDIKDLGSLKEAAKIFVPRGANLYSARTIKIREDETIRSYYFYEFRVDDQHVALVAAVNNGKTYIAGATAPQLKWENDGVKLRSAAISLSVL